MARRQLFPPSPMKRTFEQALATNSPSRPKSSLSPPLSPDLLAPVVLSRSQAPLKVLKIEEWVNPTLKLAPTFHRHVPRPDVIVISDSDVSEVDSAQTKVYKELRTPPQTPPHSPLLSDDAILDCTPTQRFVPSDISDGDSIDPDESRSIELSEPDSDLERFMPDSGSDDGDNVPHTRLLNLARTADLNAPGGAPRKSYKRLKRKARPLTPPDLSMDLDLIELPPGTPITPPLTPHLDEVSYEADDEYDYNEISSQEGREIVLYYFGQK